MLKGHGSMIIYLGSITGHFIKVESHLRRGGGGGVRFTNCNQIHHFVHIFVLTEVMRCYGSELCPEIFENNLFSTLDGDDNIINNDDLGLDFLQLTNGLPVGTGQSSPTTASSPASLPQVANTPHLAPRPLQQGSTLPQTSSSKVRSAQPSDW